MRKLLSKAILFGLISGCASVGDREEYTEWANECATGDQGSCNDLKRHCEKKGSELACSTLASVNDGSWKVPERVPSEVSPYMQMDTAPMQNFLNGWANPPKPQETTCTSEAQYLYGKFTGYKTVCK